MSDRITMNAISNTVMAANQNTINQLATYQQQLSTGLRVNQPSDDPDASDQSMNYQAQLDANTAFQSNINTATATMTDSDNALTQVSQILTQVQGDAVEGANGTQTASSNQALGQSVTELLGQLISVANTQSNGQYIYAGTATNTKPFALSADGSQVTYQGDVASYSVQIGPNSSLPVNQSGEAIFKSPVDVFNTLIQLSSALNSNNTTAVSGLLTSISQASQQIDTAHGGLGGSEQRLTLAQTQLQNSTTSLTNLLGQTVDADLPQTVTDMQQEEAQLQSGLEAAAKIIQPDLLSYLNG